ncbi:MAG TPA: permease prefix domain 1-containing protein [Nocardioidaceae bacterium]|nr:permease prefix domain 1-containing protein [Nocardioidaceae bacterium]
MNEPTIDDYLDELLRRTHADARTTRRLIDEASDHLEATAAQLEEDGMPRRQAELEAVRRFGPVGPIVRATFRRSLGALVLDTLRAGLFLAGCGLVAVGLSGLVALVMNLWAGQSFVGGETLFPGPGAPVREVAADAVVLRVIAGLAGLVMLLAYLGWRRYTTSVSRLPDGLVDALGAAAFAAGTAALAIASADQAAQTGTPGVGFPLSGAVVALPATVYFCVRAVRALLPAASGSDRQIGGRVGPPAAPR